MNQDCNIIFLNRFFYPDYSATSQMLTELAFDLAARGERLHVVTSRLSYEDPDACLAPMEQVNGIQVHRIWTSRFGRHFLLGRAMDYATFYLGALWILLRLVKRGDLVVAMTDPPLISLVAALVARLKGALLINWTQDLFPEVAQALGIPGMGGRFAGVLRWMRNLSLSAARMNVVIGERMAAKLRQEGIREEQIRVIHNWAVGNLVSPIPPEENPLRREWGLTDRFVVGYSGNMGRAHEFATLLAAAKLLQSQPEVVFLFIGGGAQRQVVVEEARRLGLDAVQFRPYQPLEQLANSLSVADVHWISLVPAMEGLIVPSKFYGSAAMGRPMVFVGEAEGEIGGLLQRFECGFTVPPGDGRQLAARIQQLAQDAALCQEMGRRAQRMLYDHFDRSLAVAAWQEMLRELRAS